MSVPRIQQTFCSTKISTVIKDAVQSLGYKEIRKDQFQNFLNTWCDHEIADSAQPRYLSIVTRPFSLLVRAGSGHETTDALEHIRGEGNPLIDETICSEVGQPLNEPSLQQLQVYPPKNVIFYAQIPYMRRHVMIRLFHFLIADLGISFTSSNYTSTGMSERELLVTEQGSTVNGRGW